MGEDDLCALAPTATAILGVVLALGTFLSFFPQHVRLMIRKSSSGLSFSALLILNISAYLTAVSTVLLQWHMFLCCFDLSFLGCNNLLLSFYQLSARWFAVFPLYILALFYFHKSASSLSKEKEIASQNELSLQVEDVESSKSYETVVKEKQEEEEREGERKMRWEIVWDHQSGDCAIYFGQFSLKLSMMDVFVSYLAFMALILALAIFLVLSDGYYGTNLSKVVGVVFGYTSSLISGIIWLPQIYLLYVTRDPGSLSLLMFSIQCPGGLLVVFFQGILEDQPVALWLGTFLAAVEQGIIVCQILYYQFISPPPPIETVTEISDEEEEEETPLLP